MNFAKWICLGAALLVTFNDPLYAALPASPIKHVVLISIDGMHEADMALFIQTHPHSALARLARDGVVYHAAYTPAPSSPLPGLLALTTGSTPGQTGIYGAATYDRGLSPAISNCKTLGAATSFDEGVGRSASGIVRGQIGLLPRDPHNHCQPISLKQFLRINTVFDVVHRAGGQSAWFGGRRPYERNGFGIDDLYTPGINPKIIGNLMSHGMNRITAVVTSAEHNDAERMAAAINVLGGLTHDGQSKEPVPSLIGIDLQAVNVAQKNAGYVNAEGMPTIRLMKAIEHCDQQVDLLMNAILKQHLARRTLVIVTGKYGNGPIAPNMIRQVDSALLEKTIARTSPHAIAQLVTNRSAMLWLTNAPQWKRQRELKKIVHALERNRKKLGIETILYGRKLDKQLGVTAKDDRVPDLVIKTKPGVFYVDAGSAQERAMHGGWGDSDRHVMLLLSNPNLPYLGIKVNDRVQTTQVAPTILSALGLKPDHLTAVAQSHIKPLPRLGLNQ